MRDRMERLVVLPFSIGCVSESSVAVRCDHPKKSKSEPNPSLMRGLEEERFSGVKMKNSFGFLSFAKPNISTGLQKLIKSIKNFSHIFVYKEEIKEVGMEMEIGFPTDVKHVTHIGWDGSAATNHIKDWDDLKAPELFSLPPISLRQFELAMAAQDDTPLLVSSSKS